MYVKCPQCGRRMKSDYPDKTRYFNCSFCRDRFFIEDDGEIVNVFYRGRKNAKTCPECGQSMAGGEYVAPWEEGNNPNGYVVCPHCHHIEILYDD